MRRDYPYPSPPRLPVGAWVDVGAWLCGTGPLEVEIGPGRGAFLLGRCLAAPEARLLGIEVRRKWASVVDARLAAAGHGVRARVVCEDAREALGRLGPDACATRVFVNFPDPWWKKRHQKRRLLGEPLLAEIARLLADGGELFVQTDVAERADGYRAMIEVLAPFEPAGDAAGVARLSLNPYGARSNRERRADEDGLPVHRLRYRRRRRG